MYGDTTLEVQHSYTYLGTLINYNGNQCHLFDACIVPILLYGCEIWGFSNITDIERVQTFFCKYILRLGTKTANCLALGELGRKRLACTIKERMINFWVRLMTGKSTKISCMLLLIIKQQQETTSYRSQWYTEIVNTLNNCGLGYIINIPPDLLNPKYIKALLKDRISAMEEQDWNSSVSNSGHCVNYRIFKRSLSFEKYLTSLNMKEAIDFCRFRCGNHKLPVVVGRYNNIERCNRVCSLCNLNTIGDEYHYIYVCPAFNQERVAYIQKKLLRNHNTLTMHSLFSSEDRTSVSNLARFCRVIMDSFKAANCQSSRKSKITEKRQKKSTSKTKQQHKRGKAENIDLSHTSPANKNRRKDPLSPREKRKKQKSKDNPRSQERQSYIVSGALSNSMVT